MRKLLWTLALLGVGLFVAKSTHFLSYAGTFWAQVKKSTKNAVPTRFEIDRVRHEIANLDGDINKMVRPIAEYMATISKLKKDIANTQTQLEEHRTTLLTMTRDLEGNPTFLVYGGEQFSADRVRHKLQKDFDSYKRIEANLKSQRTLLEAKETSLKATQEQLAKVMSKKRDYEVRLAQLEADEETLQIARIGSKLQIDDSRATQIEAALSGIEHRHNVQRAEVELKTGQLASDVIPVNQRQAKMDLNAIRNYLEGTTSTASDTNP
ncbi:MAG: hypothetical protein L0Y72_21510 [Gemmataceae bacterium]|nr:hypothetical protein [Gemmataceae bacterium]MCI0741620.1 hypothetical protein [Gemmataceae bacterium]